MCEKRKNRKRKEKRPSKSSVESLEFSVVRTTLLTSRTPTLSGKRNAGASKRPSANKQRLFLSIIFFFILRRMVAKKTQYVLHTSMYFHKRRVSEYVNTCMSSDLAIRVWVAEDSNRPIIHCYQYVRLRKTRGNWRINYENNRNMQRKESKNIVIADPKY